MKNQRGRGWRRAKTRQHNGKGMGGKRWFKPEKNWKHLYLRSVKIARARQLGFEYPRKYTRQLLEEADHVDDS